MRAVNVLLSILVSLSLAFLVFEGGLRIVPAFRPQEALNEFHPELGWAKKPSAHVERSTGEFDVTFETNAQGLRDVHRASPAKPPNTLRVLMLGDSFVLGYTVDREDLFVDQLRHWWNAEQRRVDVVNAGTEGYSTDQQALWFERYGREYAPDVVLLFPYENDVYWNGESAYTRYPKPRYRPDGTLESGKLEDPGPSPFLQRLAIGQFLGKVVLPLLGPGTRGKFQPEGSEAWIPREFAPLLAAQPDFLADAKERTRGALRALKRASEDVGARLVMVPIPSESAIHPNERERFRENVLGGLDNERWSPDRPVDFFLGAAKELGIETLDPRSTLRAAGKDEALYYAAEWHFNPAGNLAFATFLKDELETLGVFPPEHAAIAPGAWPAPQDEGGLPTWMVVFAALWLVLGTSYALTYRDEPAWFGALKVGALLGTIFLIFFGVRALVGAAGPEWTPWILGGFVVVVLGFVAWKLGRRLSTILELLQAFTLRGHWYLMPLVVVLLTIGSLLVVAASSPLIAPFIYTLF